MLNLWDCGGQDSFYESYFNHQQDYIFRSVEVTVIGLWCPPKSKRSCVGLIPLWDVFLGCSTAYYVLSRRV